MARRKKRRITKKELRSRFGFLLLAFFGFYLIAPIRESLSTNFQLEPMTQIIIGIGGILTVLYFFDF